MVRKTFFWIKNNLLEFFAGAMIAAVIALIVVTLLSGIANESNRITEGIIVDKDYTAPYSSITYHTINGNSYPVSRYHPENFQFKIKGDKNSKTVEYVFDVTENEYNSYNVGDYYKK